MLTDTYLTRGGVTVRRTVEDIPVAGAIEPLIDALDDYRGALLASSYEYPGRYTRWDMGFVRPPLEIVARGCEFQINALNERGQVLVAAIVQGLQSEPALLCHSERSEESVLAERMLHYVQHDKGNLPATHRGTQQSCIEVTAFARDRVLGRIVRPEERFTEEERTKQPSTFTLLRALLELFGSDADGSLGLYGAFGYDLAFQFDAIRQRLERGLDQRDLVLYLPDEIVLVDHQADRAIRRRYDFEAGGKSTDGLERAGSSRPFTSQPAGSMACDHAPGEYAMAVEQAREKFRRGDLFEVVLSQTFSEPCPAAPSELFRRLRERNPAPYGFLINLGQSEYLVGASPEMYVRVDGDRVETCPISGTIARGGDAIADAAQILQLLGSAKDEAELTMCTDVDRNDKSRICQPGSVRVIGRRQIEMYSKLIHTVDHVEGHLRPEFDALDAFLAHTWAVTVTGAPKHWAIQFIEDHEKSARAWYGGAVGLIGFDGNMNTGLTLRTIRVNNGVAEIRVGATLLYDSDPTAEEEETRLKASAFVDAIHRPRSSTPAASLAHTSHQPGSGKRVLLVDHQDSFVHTLADYFRQTGAEVVTLRAGFPTATLDELRPDLVVLSPGPGQPSDFDVAGTVRACLERDLPLFGVCLGLQGIVEYFGGRLALLDEPVHGKPSAIRVLGGRLLDGLPSSFEAGRYHSLYAQRETLPPDLMIAAETDDGLIMAVEHRGRPISAVQFHPESIMTLKEQTGLRLVANAMQMAGVPAT